MRKLNVLGMILACSLVMTFMVSSAMAAYAKGDRVLGKWKDNRWYPARVAAVSGGNYTVNFDDGDVSTLPEAKLKKVDWKVGTAVQCNWKLRGKYYPGKITKMNGEAVHISYNDGDQEDITISRCRTP